MNTKTFQVFSDVTTQTNFRVKNIASEM